MTNTCTRLVIEPGNGWRYDVICAIIDGELCIVIPSIGSSADHMSPIGLPGPAWLADRLRLSMYTATALHAAVSAWLDEVTP